jgi:hypothetical protein
MRFPATESVLLDRLQQAWVEEASEIDRAPERLRVELACARRSHAVTSPSWQRVLDGFRREAAELNRRILTYNLKCPSLRFHKLPLDSDAEVAEVSSAKVP